MGRRPFGFGGSHARRSREAGRLRAYPQVQGDTLRNPSYLVRMGRPRCDPINVAATLARLDAGAPRLAVYRAYAEIAVRRYSSGQQRRRGSLFGGRVSRYGVDWHDGPAFLSERKQTPVV